MLRRRVEDPPQVVHAGGPVDRQTELGELQRDVPPDAGGDDRIQHRKVAARGGVGFRRGAHALPEQVERLQQARRFDGARRGDRLGDRFAGDEPAREAARTPHPVVRSKILERAAGGEGGEDCLGNRLQHQCVRGARRRSESRCWIVRA